MDRELQPGAEIAGYRIEGLIGRGGMGIVYLAEHMQLEKKVALKILAPELADDANFRERFVRECRLAAALDHPNIVSVDYAGQSEGQLFIAMRLVRGRDLSQLLAAEAPLDPWRAVLLLEQAASALDTAHEAGLVHRDVKPANILVAEPASPTSSIGERLFLTDFGLTKRLDSQTALTKTGSFMGTLNYAAPEQIKGEQVDGRCDQYSLACVAFECLTGATPFSADSDAGVLGAHLFGPIPIASSKRMDLPRGVDEVIARALAKDPKDRYDTCLDFVAELRALVQAPSSPPPISPPAGIPSTVMAASPISEATAAPPEPPAPLPVAVAPTEMVSSTPPSAVTPAPPLTPPPLPAAPTGGGGGRGRVIATIVLLVLLVAGGTVFALTRNGGKGTSAESSSPSLTTSPSTSTSTPTPTATPSPAPVLDPELPDGRSFGFIRSMDPATGTLRFDLAYLMQGSGANKVAAHGPVTLAANDYSIVNENPILRTLAFVPDVKIRLVDLNNCCDATLVGDLALFAENIGKNHPIFPYNAARSARTG